MIEKIIAELGPWTWWIVGFLLLILEIAAPGIFFLWIGAAAILVGTLALVVPFAWQAQIVLFAVLALLFALLGRRIARRFQKPGGKPGLNERGEAFVGQYFMLHEPSVNGAARVRIGDSFWLVRGPDGLDAGARVRVTRVDGTVLIVEAA